VQRVNRDLEADYSQWHVVPIEADNPVPLPHLLDVLGELRWSWLKKTPGGSYWLQWHSGVNPKRYQLVFEREEDALLFRLTWT
jgi:hypothetical protein